MRGTSEDQTFPQVQDDVSLTNGNGDGFTFCGTRAFDIVTSSLVYSSWGSLAVDTFSVLTNNNADANVYSITVRTYLTEVTSRATDATFTVTIGYC